MCYDHRHVFLSHSSAACGPATVIRECSSSGQRVGCVLPASLVSRIENASWYPSDVVVFSAFSVGPLRVARGGAGGAGVENGVLGGLACFFSLGCLSPASCSWRAWRDMPVWWCSGGSFVLGSWETAKYEAGVACGSARRPCRHPPEQTLHGGLFAPRKIASLFFLLSDVCFVGRYTAPTRRLFLAGGGSMLSRA